MLALAKSLADPMRDSMGIAWIERVVGPATVRLLQRRRPQSVRALDAAISLVLIRARAGSPLDISMHYLVRSHLPEIEPATRKSETR